MGLAVEALVSRVPGAPLLSAIPADLAVLGIRLALGPVAIGPSPPLALGHGADTLVGSENARMEMLVAIWAEAGFSCHLGTPVRNKIPILHRESPLAKARTTALYI